MKPGVTVYITTKDRRAMLERAVMSVINQTLQPDEIIVIDDGSTDETSVYLGRLASTDSRFRVYRNEQSIGAPASRNRAIAATRTEFLTGLDDDDEFLPDRLADFMRNRDRLSTCAALGTSMILQRRRLRIKRRPVKSIINLDDLLIKNHVGNQVFTYTHRWREIGGFDPDFPAMQDYECWVRLVLGFGPIYMIHNASTIIHMEHEAARVTSSCRRANAVNRFYQKHGSLLGPKQARAAALHRLICGGNRMTLSFLMSNYIPELHREFWRYYLSSNSSTLRGLKELIFR